MAAATDRPGLSRWTACVDMPELLRDEAPADRPVWTRAGNHKSLSNRSLLRCGAFTLLEMLAAVAIVTILAVILVGNYDRIVAAAQQAVCAGNMRSIHAALNLYLQDNKDVWPQPPDLSEEKQWEAFWLKTLSPFGISQRTWQCPAIRALARRDGEEGAQIHYAPSSFDETPGIARRWPTQPWLIERGDIHGRGPLICFPDGSVESFQKVLYRQGMLR